MRKILFGLTVLALVAVGSLAPAQAQVAGGITLDHQGGRYDGFDRKYGGDSDHRYGGNYDRKYSGDYDRKYGGDYDHKYGGDYDHKYGVDYDRKYGGDSNNVYQRYRPN
jgi:hypothetical protein